MKKQPEQPKQQQQLMTSKQLAAHLGMSVAWIKKMRANSNIPCLKLGKSLRFDLDKVNQWIEEKNNTARGKTRCN